MGNKTSSQQPKAKTFIFHHGTAEQNISVFPGTPADSIISLVLHRLGLHSGVSATDVLLLDANGNPIVFYPDSIPDQYHMYIHVESNVGEEDEETHSQSAFKWDSSVLPLINFRYQLDQSRRVVLGSSSNSTGMPILCSDRFFEADSGVHTWRVKWECEGPYRGVGLLSTEEKDKLSTHDYGSNFDNFPLFHRTHDNSRMSMTYSLDMNKRILTITGDGGDVYVRGGIPAKVWVGITVKHALPNQKAAEVFFT